MRSVAVLELTLRGVARGEARDEDVGLPVVDTLLTLSRGGAADDEGGATLPIPKKERWVGDLGGVNGTSAGLLGGELGGTLPRLGSTMGAAPLGTLPAPKKDVPAAIFSLCVKPFPSLGRLILLLLPPL